MNSEIRTAVKDDIPALCEIWKACFNDTTEYINCFYKENFEHISILVYTENEKVLSMVNLIDCSFVSNEGNVKAKFLYAVGTLPCYRKKSCFTRLLKHLENDAKQNGYALFLKPSNESIIKYYEKSGFIIDSYLRIVTIPPNEENKLTVKPLSSEEYNRMRNAELSTQAYVKWDDFHVKWCVLENGYFGGKTLSVELNGKEYYIMCYPEEDMLTVTETNLSVSQLKQISGYMCKMFGKAFIKAYMPDSCSQGEKTVSSLIYNAPKRNTYVNLILI
ncbi:MAG: GNAT family N-acetyltransferase [Eubacterium sp.]|nr:GNAT family N-acetyltransferase [Eubacterium sp.]